MCLSDRLPSNRNVISLQTGQRWIWDSLYHHLFPYASFQSWLIWEAYLQKKAQVDWRSNLSNFCCIRIPNNAADFRARTFINLVDSDAKMKLLRLLETEIKRMCRQGAFLSSPPGRWTTVLFFLSVLLDPRSREAQLRLDGISESIES